MTNHTRTEGFLSYNGHQTWYQVVGDLQASPTPLVALHGGPGAAHNYLQTLDTLADDGRAVVFYDQLGCGNSTRLPEAPAEYWTVDLFLGELNALLTHLGIADRYAVLGQSWGGMLAAEHALRQPAGLRSLVLSNALPSSASWAAGATRLRSMLPPETLATLEAHEAAGTVSDPAYVAATEEYYARHVCRVPMPDHVLKSFTMMSEDPTVYGTMWGPNEFAPVGSLKEWSVVDQLPQIVAPTLVIAGEFDEATSECQDLFMAGIPNATQVVVPEASHMALVENPEIYFGAVRSFLAAHD